MDIYEQRLRAGIVNLWNNQKKAKHEMRDATGGRCCMAVIEDTAFSFGLPYEENEALPSGKCREFFGLSRMTDYGGGMGFCPTFGSYGASGLNDGADDSPELSHKELAILFCDLHPNLGDLKEYFQKRIHEFVEHPAEMCL